MIGQAVLPDGLEIARTQEQGPEQYPNDVTTRPTLAEFRRAPVTPSQATTPSLAGVAGAHGNRVPIVVRAVIAPLGYTPAGARHDRAPSGGC